MSNYENEEEYMDSLKQDDHYSFSIPFEYIAKNHGNGNYDIEEAIMEVDVDWDASDHGYRVSFYCPDSSDIDPAEGNSSIEEFYDAQVEEEVLDRLDSMGITAEAMVGGDGR